MSKQIVSPEREKLEQALELVFSSPQIDPERITGIERELLANYPDFSQLKPTRRESILYFFRQKQLARYAFQFVFAVLLIILAFNASAVLAQVQRWLGYVPGIGFVDLVDAKVLSTPVSQTRQGVTLQVLQVFAGEDQTHIVISSEGLPPENIEFDSDHPVLPSSNIRLRLPNGETLQPVTFDLYWGAGTIKFPPLPANVNEIYLEMHLLPLVAEGLAPQDWSVKLTLQPAVDNGTEQDSLPAAYALENAQDTHHQVTIRVKSVAHSDLETAVQLEVTWGRPGQMRSAYIDYARFFGLQDDLGHIYLETIPSPGSEASVVVALIEPVEVNPLKSPDTEFPPFETTLAFHPVSAIARDLTLKIDQVSVSLPVEDAAIAIDLGDDPQAGDEWTLDTRLNLAGFPVHVTGARLVEKHYGSEDTWLELEFLISADVDPDGLSIEGIYADSLDFGFISSYPVHTENLVVAVVGIPNDGAFPTGLLELPIREIEVMVQGPWKVAWQIPDKDTPVAEVSVFHPQGIADQSAGITLEVAEVILTDRLSIIGLTASGQPDGVRILQLRSGSDRPILKDDLNKSIGLLDSIRWASDGEVYNPYIPEPGGLLFAPVPPLTQSLDLTIPAIELFVPGNSAWEIDVPPNLDFHPEEITVNVVGGGRQEREETEIRWVTSPWEILIPIEIAGFKLTLTQAYLERWYSLEGTDYRLFLTGEVDNPRLGDWRLREFVFSSVTAPNGNEWNWDNADFPQANNDRIFGSVAVSPPLRAGAEFVIGLKIEELDGVDILGGTYRVTTEGVVAAIPGPWHLSWDLFAP